MRYPIHDHNSSSRTSVAVVVVSSSVCNHAKLVVSRSCHGSYKRNILFSRSNHDLAANGHVVRKRAITQHVFGTEKVICLSVKQKDRISQPRV